MSVKDLRAKYYDILPEETYFMVLTLHGLDLKVRVNVLLNLLDTREVR